MSASGQNDLFADERILAMAMRLPSFEEALARLLFVVEHRRPGGLVVGLAGTGKSLLLEAVSRELGGAPSTRSLCRPLPINLRGCGGTELPWKLAATMGLSPRENSSAASLWQAVEDRFQGAAMSGLSIVPIIDHLEQSDRLAVTALGVCCHLAVQFGSTVLVSARPPVSGSLAEVVGPLCDLRIELPLWTVQETSAFVSGALEEAQSLELGPSAVEAIHACAGGRLRDTVQVLRLVLFATRTQGLDRIDAALVETVAGEIWQPATDWRTGRLGLPSSAALAAARS